ncbi:hypothetical protein BDR22DRAFT_963013 [Usnea florida]
MHRMSSSYTAGQKVPVRKKESETQSETQSESAGGRSESSKSLPVSPTITCTDFYASTTPEPQRPYCYRPIAKAEATEWSGVCSQAADLLIEWHFDFQSVDILNVQLKDGSFQPRLGVGVSSTKDHDRWTEIIVSLSKKIPRLGFDIESPNQNPDSNSNSIFAIKSGHPFIKTWSGLRDKVLQSLQGYEWEAIDVFLYGETFQISQPTIFVTIDRQQSYKSSELRRRVYKVVSSQCKVEIREGNLQACATRINDTNPTGSVPHQAYARQVHGGWGIGVDNNSTGTLGGFVTLCDDHGNKKVYGLTNYHVIRPETRNFPAGIDRGSTEDAWPPEFINIYSSSEQDFEEEKRVVELELAGNKTEWQLFHPSTLRNAQMGQTIPETDRRQLEYLQKRKSLLETRLGLLNSLQDTERRLGRVAYYGGFRVDKNSRMDWALIEVAQERVGVNRLPTLEEIPPDFSLEGDRISRISKTSEDTTGLGRYFKIGRTTGLTFGESHKIESEVWLEVPLNDGDQGSKKRKIRSQARVIVAPKGSENFNRGGDSGAWVCDRFGSLVGLVWGGEGQKCYYTPIGLIIADIEARTGREVGLP